MLLYECACAAMLLGSSIASPIVRRQTNEVFNGTGSPDASESCTLTFTFNGTDPFNTTWPSNTSWPSNVTWPSNNTYPYSFNLTLLNSSCPSFNSTTLDPKETTIYNLGPGNGSYPANTTSSPNGTDTYYFYQGNGSIADGWPALAEWASFDDLWTANQPLIANACVNLLTPPNNHPNETATIHASILAIAAATNVDPRFILAIMLQESKGCVRVITTYGSVSNPGLMQSHDGNHTCLATDPCPAAEIYGMIDDGVAGTASGPGLAALLQLVAGSESASGVYFADPAQLYYEAARMYDSGTIAPDGNLGDGAATHCYASDIANRLTGWVYATSTCTLDIF